MNVKDAIANRFSVRRYGRETIPYEHMETLFKALQLAPSANNGQNWEFIFVSDPDLKWRLIPACFNQRFVGECPYFIAALSDPRFKWHQVDIAISLTNFTLQATELGYGTCWVGAFDESMVKELLGVPREKKVVVCMTFGIPAASPLPKWRKEIGEFIFHDKYGHPWDTVPG